MIDKYKKQVLLLIQAIPEINKDKNFALHGGTAINLFYLNMPRLSVDIDLTYIPFTQSRKNDFESIRIGLEQLKHSLRNSIRGIVFHDQKRTSEDLKVICSTPEATIKIEVNQINRGLIEEAQVRTICKRAQIEFNLFTEIQVVPIKQLWGGKIVAALDRQHPRDLFDVKGLLKAEGYTHEVHKGFLFSLLGSNRPIHEILSPSIINQKDVLESHFIGMTEEAFSYEEFLSVRDQLIHHVKSKLTIRDKAFLISFSKGEPDWSEFNYSMYPSVRWKLLNIEHLKKNQPNKFKEQIKLLENLF